MLWVLILPLLIFIPSLGFYIFSPGSSYSDLLITHLPNALFLQRSLAEWGQIPLWSPAILSGFPFAANPLSGLWYLPGWLTVLFPTPLGFNLAVVAHFLFGGIGLYLFLRSENIAAGPALLGAVLFEALPKSVAHFSAGHITLLYAVSWTPWLLLAERKRWTSLRTSRLLFGPGVVLGVIALADVRWTIPAGLLWLGYLISRSEIIPRQDREAVTGKENSPAWTRALENTGKLLSGAASQVVIGLMVAAPVLLPLWEYTKLSTRSQLTSSDTLLYSLPVGRLLGLLYPAFGTSAEWVLYPTAVGLVFVLLSLLVPWLRRRAGFWLVVFFVSLVYSLGEAVPLLPYLGSVPGFNLIRVPARMLFLTGLSVAVLAAYGANALLSEGVEKRLGDVAGSRLGLTALAVFSLLVPAGIWTLAHDLPLNFIWGSIGIALAAGWIMLRLGEKVSPGLWILGLFALVLVDQGFVNWKAIDPRWFGTPSAESTAAAAFLSAQPDRFRTYSPSYSLPQQVAAEYHLELADGIDPLQLSAYRNFMMDASGIPSPGYSVTLPAFSSADPDRDNLQYLPDPRLLGLLNVRYVLAAYDLPVKDLRLRVRFGETRIYENLAGNPRAWVEPGQSGGDIQRAAVTRWSPNQVDLEAEGPGALVLSEMNYPGWQVWVDGVRANILTLHDLLRGVDLPAGTHLVQFTFQPATVYTGAAVSAFTWVLLGLFFLVRRRQAL